MNLDRQYGYCTNVHAGSDLATTQANLVEHALAVKQKFSPDAPMGIGLWLSAATASDLIIGQRVTALREWLQQHALVPFTLNGFPFGDFHQKVVKHQVYLPTWADRQRFDYTIQLIDILHQILPENIEGSISTLPIGWPAPQPTPEFMNFAAEQLRRVARHLEQLEQQTGRLIYLCIEPEPGCLLQTSGGLIDFFENQLIQPSRADELLIRRYLRVCHDVCHAAVMFEPQRTVLESFRDAGIRVGKVQVSSAICLPLASLDVNARSEAIAQLSAFSEDRYLHQTTVRQASGVVRFYEDLPQAIAAFDPTAPENEELRVHFHVPVYLEEFGLLKTSRADIQACLSAIQPEDQLTHFEVETYAWNVLPPALQHEKLADGIADEMHWFRATMGD
jgi:hypothetical protein